MGVADAARLASVVSLVGIDTHVVPLAGVGCAVVPVAEAEPLDPPDDAARRLSRVLRRVDVLALSYEEGQVQAQRWRRGAMQSTPAPGLVMGSVPAAVERLLLSGADPAAEPGVVHTASRGPGGAEGGSRWSRFLRGR